MPRRLNYKESKTRELQGATKLNTEGIFPQGLGFVKTVVLRKPNQKSKKCRSVNTYKLKGLVHTKVKRHPFSLHHSGDVSNPCNCFGLSWRETTPPK